MHSAFTWHQRLWSLFYPVELRAGTKKIALIRMVKPDEFYEYLLMERPASPWVPVKGSIEQAKIMIEIALKIHGLHLKETWEKTNR